MTDRLCIGNESDPEAVRDAVRGLKMMARLGRRAQRALESLERDGEIPERVVWLKVGDTWSNGLERLQVRTSGPWLRHRPVSRDDVPGWSDISMDLGSVEEDTISGSVVKCFQVGLSGTCLWWNREEQEVARRGLGSPSRKFSGSIGYVRLKKSGSPTFDPDHGHWDVPPDDRKVFRISSDEAVARIADLAACRLVTPSLMSYDDSYPVLMKDLRREIPKWLVEDGMAQKWRDQICEWASSVRVVAEVMDT